MLIPFVYALSALLNCAEPKIVNLTQDPWNDNDQYTLRAAKETCKRRYPNTPCVITFTKKEARKDGSTYNVICGREQGKDKANVQQ